MRFGAFLFYFTYWDLTGLLSPPPPKKKHHFLGTIWTKYLLYFVYIFENY